MNLNTVCFDVSVIYYEIDLVNVQEKKLINDAFTIVLVDGSVIKGTKVPVPVVHNY